MRKLSVTKKVLALACAASLLAAAPLVLAGGEGYLGVVLQQISPSMATALQLGDAGGILVSEVMADSPAEKAGLKAGDVILSFAGAELGKNGNLTKAVQATSPGDEADVVVLRDGQKRTITVEVGEREDDFVWTTREGDRDFEFHGEEGNVWIQSFGDDEDDHDIYIEGYGEDDDRGIKIIMKGLNEDRGFLGVHLDDIEGQMAEFYEVEDGKGALVTEVVEDSGAAAAGLKAGDVIVRIGDEDITDAADVHEALSGTEADEKLKIEVVRKGKNKSFDVTLGEMPEDSFSRQMQIIGDGDNYRVMVPKMMHRMPEMMHDIHVAPHVQVMRDVEIEQEALEEMKAELKEMKKELEEMKKELKK